MTRSVVELSCSYCSRGHFSFVHRLRYWPVSRPSRRRDGCPIFRRRPDDVFLFCCCQVRNGRLEPSLKTAPLFIRFKCSVYRVFAFLLSSSLLSPEESGDLIRKCEANVSSFQRTMFSPSTDESWNANTGARRNTIVSLFFCYRIWVGRVFPNKPASTSNEIRCDSTRCLYL